jgi:hypothetical protein
MIVFSSKMCIILEQDFLVNCISLERRNVTVYLFHKYTICIEMERIHLYQC